MCVHHVMCVCIEEGDNNNPTQYIKLGVTTSYVATECTNENTLKKLYVQRSGQWLSLKYTHTKHYHAPALYLTSCNGGHLSEVATMSSHHFQHKAPLMTGCRASETIQCL